jgi:isopenicillin N synthase-like dioxygenase
MIVLTILSRFSTRMNRGDLHECFDIGYDASADSCPVPPSTLKDLYASGQIIPSVWPPSDVLPGFSDTVRAYHRQVLDLSRKLFQIFALALGMPESYFDKCVTNLGLPPPP